jgi:hypothetical protein
VDAINKQVTLTDAERLDRLRLIRSDNVGPRTFNSLLHHFGNARAALENCPIWRGAAALHARDGFAPRMRRAPKSWQAKSSASACSPPANPAIRRGRQRLTTRRPCSA